MAKKFKQYPHNDEYFTLLDVSIQKCKLYLDTVKNSNNHEKKAQFANYFNNELKFNREVKKYPPNKITKMSVNYLKNNLMAYNDKMSSFLIDIDIAES